MARLELITATQVETSSVKKAQPAQTEGAEGVARSRNSAVAAPIRGRDVTSLSAAGGAVVQGLAGSDVRFAKVAALQQAIASGTYNVPAGEVANKLIETLQRGR